MSELAGETEQADELAKWLRGVTRGVTVKRLADDFGYINKNRWTPFRNGSELIPEELMERVVEKYALPVEREIQVRRGRELLNAARRAQRAKSQIRVRRGRGAPEPGADAVAGAVADADAGEATAVDALLRLAASQEQLIEAERKLRDSEVREMYLKKVVSDLRRKQTLTEVERDRAREEAREALAREVRLLAGYRRRAGDQLERARRSHASALELRLAADEKVVRDQAAVHDAVSAEDGPALPEPVPAAETAELPALDRIGEALHMVDDDLEQHERELSDLREEIGPEFLTGSGRTKVLRGRFADSADDAPTGDGSTSSATAEAVFARGEPDGGHGSSAGVASRRRRWLRTGLVAGAAVLVLIPLTSYESGTVRLAYDGGSIPHTVIGSGPAPSYSWKHVSSQETLTGTEGLQATFVPASQTPAVPWERRFKARLLLSVPEGADAICTDSDRLVAVSWAVVDGTEEIASGSLVRKDGESAAIDRPLPYAPDTLSLIAGRTVNTRERCDYTLRLEEPAIHYRGWWARA